ncbi:bacteriocin immunity protein [Lactococcus kimchii]|uniref:bacteriocin immunity protein n=1 Tax=Lactococcus sp. S-13 TaxID=2507158 RepID=UPI001023EBDC|nr:bacteriocin immunity protein [Lactococcus sp. S-13]RZI48818.1 bacteriocin immunity protein [Lactococcus sp. S-13]
MKKINEQEAILNELYNLILDRGTREWERQFLLESKNRIEQGETSLSAELSRLESNLRPLALRYNLTPQVTLFYQKISESKLFGRGVGGIL